jgi:hypothetical protein
MNFSFLSSGKNTLIRTLTIEIPLHQLAKLQLLYRTEKLFGYRLPLVLDLRDSFSIHFFRFFLWVIIFVLCFHLYF